MVLILHYLPIASLYISHNNILMMMMMMKPRMQTTTTNRSEFYYVTTLLLLPATQAAVQCCGWLCSGPFYKWTTTSGRTPARPFLPWIDGVAVGHRVGTPIKMHPSLVVVQNIVSGLCKVLPFGCCKRRITKKYRTTTGSSK